MRSILYPGLVVLTICIQSTAAQAQVTVAQLLTDDPRLEAFSSFAATIPESIQLNEPGSFTIFAFTNKAFNSLPNSEKADLLGANQQKRRKLVGYHIHKNSTLTANRIPRGSTFLKTMLRKERFCIRKTNNQIFITDGLGRRAKVISTKKIASNGVVHVIDKVLTPGTPNACR